MATPSKLTPRSLSHAWRPALQRSQQGVAAAMAGSLTVKQATADMSSTAPVVVASCVATVMASADERTSDGPLTPEPVSPEFTASQPPSAPGGCHLLPDTPVIAAGANFYPPLIAAEEQRYNVPAEAFVAAPKKVPRKDSRRAAPRERQRPVTTCQQTKEIAIRKAVGAPFDQPRKSVRAKLCIVSQRPKAASSEEEQASVPHTARGLTRPPVVKAHLCPGQSPRSSAAEGPGRSGRRGGQPRQAQRPPGASQRRGTSCHHPRAQPLGGILRPPARSPRGNGSTSSRIPTPSLGSSQVDSAAQINVKAMLRGRSFEQSDMRRKASLPQQVPAQSPALGRTRISTPLARPRALSCVAEEFPRFLLSSSAPHEALANALCTMEDSVRFLYEHGPSGSASTRYRQASIDRELLNRSSTSADMAIGLASTECLFRMASNDSSCPSEGGCSSTVVEASTAVSKGQKQPSRWLSAVLVDDTLLQAPVKQDEAQVGTRDSFESEEVHPDPDEPQQVEETVPCTVMLPQPLQARNSGDAVVEVELRLDSEPLEGSRARTDCQRLDSCDPAPYLKIQADGLDEAMATALDAASNALVAALGGLNSSLRNREVFAAEAMSTAIEN